MAKFYTVMKRNILRFGLGPVFPFPLFVAGWVLGLPLLVIAVISNSWPGILISLPLMLLATTWEGIAIDAEKKKLKGFIRVLGIPIGKKWKSFNDYPFLSVLRNSKPSIPSFFITDFFLFGSLLSGNHENGEYEIYLLSKRHQKGSLLYRSRNHRKVKALAEQLKEKMEVELVRFDPTQF